MAIASSMSLKALTATAGPNNSSRDTFISGLASATTVGACIVPFVVAAHQDARAPLLLPR